MLFIYDHCQIIKMNKNVFLICLISGIIFISGCVQQGIEQQAKIPESPNKLEISGAPAPPADQALAEIAIISQNNDEWNIRVDKIRDYIRYPNAKNPILKEGEEISLYVNGFLDTFEYRGPVCPPGYVKSPKPAEAQPTTASSRSVPKIAAGDKYLSKLLGCFEELNCQRIGWSGYLYNPNPIVVETECVLTSE